MEKLLKVEQVVELLQVSKRTIYDWTHTEYIPHVKLPKYVRFKENDVLKWINKKRKFGRNKYKIDDQYE